MTTISDLTALLVQHGWPRLEPLQGNDNITQPLPSGPWWCCDPDQLCITLHPQTAFAITVGFEPTSGTLLDVTAWSDLFQDDNNPDAPVELLSLGIWPPDPPQQSLDLILQLSEQQLQAISLVANS